MKLVLYIFVLYLISARAAENSQSSQQTETVVFVDKSEENGKQSEHSDDRHKRGGLGYALLGEAAGGFIGPAPLAEGIIGLAPFAEGIISSAPAGGIISSAPLSGGIIGSGPGGIIGSGPAGVLAGPAPGLYTEAIASDPVAYGSAYAPSYAGCDDDDRCVGVPVSGPAIPLGQQFVSQQIEITKQVPVPVYKPVAVAVPHPVPYPVPQPVAVRVPHPVPVEVPVPVTVLKQVPYPVEKPVPFPVDRPYPVKIYKKIPVPVPKPYPVHIYKVKHIYHHEPHHKGWGWD